MMELEDMPGMSPIFRISRLGTSSLKKDRLSLRSSSKCEPKTGPPKLALATFCCMKGGRARKKTHFADQHMISEDAVVAEDLTVSLTKKRHTCFLLFVCSNYIL